MNLVWKLLRRHISPLQLLGFFAANLLGMFILLLGLQFYTDVKPLLSGKDGVLGTDYLIVSKRVSAASVLGDEDGHSFDSQEIDELSSQPFCKSVGTFTASHYAVECRLAIKGMANFGTDMFFESVPDRYVDAHLAKWSFDPSHPEIPIVLPRSYLAIYNFGFAQAQHLPKISEGIIGLIEMEVTLKGNGMVEQFPAKVVGFSSRLNTILVPQEFMLWSNQRFSSSESGKPTRLIVEVGNPADDAIATYMSHHGYELEDDKLESGRASYFLKVAAAVVMGVGLLICLLSLYILMLSIYLLVQKNTEKLRNLMLIGYSPSAVALPYQILTMSINAAVFLLAFALLVFIRNLYMERLWEMFPSMDDVGLGLVFMAGALLLTVVSVLNVWAVRRRMMAIWHRKA
ncbi:MAG: ABC transporter permease [Bacteroidaceae bacterium]